MADVERIKEKIKQLEDMLTKINDPELEQQMMVLITKLMVVLYEHEQLNNQ
jgi:hypothetical protein